MGIDTSATTAGRVVRTSDGRLASRNRVFRCLALLGASVVLVTMLTPGLSSAVTSLGGWGSLGSGTGQFDRPLGVTSFGAGSRVYVTDKVNNRIEEFNDRGNFVRSFGREATGERLPGAPVNTPPIREPWAIAVVPKPNGDVYVTSAVSGSIYQYTADGGFIRSWRPYSQAGGAATPCGLAVSPVNGDVYLASVTRLERFTAEGKYISDFPLAVINNRRSASGVAIAPNGDVFVSSYSNVQVYQSNGQLIRSWGIDGTDPGQFKLAVGIAVSERGDVFVLDSGRYSGRVQHFTSEGMLLQSWGDDVSLTGPSGIGVTGNGVVFVANTNRNRIESYRP
jgi:tripartite motif-containing protein 71